MKKIMMFVVVIALSFLLISCGNDDRIQIGILQFGQFDALDQARLGFIEALEEHGLTEDKVNIRYENSNTNIEIQGSQAELLIQTSDLVLGIATPSAQALVNAAIENNIYIPILFTAVTDPVGAGLIESNELPGANVTGTNDMNPISEQIALAKELLPEATKLGILYTSSESNSEIQALEAKDIAEDIGFTVTELTISTSSNLEQTARTLARDVDIIFVPTDNIIAENINVLGQVLEDIGIPAIVGEEGMVDGVPGLTIGINYFNLGIITGNMAADILLNNKLPKDIPSVGLDIFSLVVNVDALDRINVTIPQTILDRIED